MQLLEHVRRLARVGQLERALQDHRTGVDPLVDEMDGDAEHLDPVGQRLLDRPQPGKRRQQRRVDVDDPLRKAAQERGIEELHIPGQHHELGPALLQPVGHGAVPLRAPARAHLERPRRNARATCPLQRARRRLVGRHRDDLHAVMAVHLIEQRLQVRALARGKNRNVHTGWSFGNRPPVERSVPFSSSWSTRARTSAERRWANAP
jgi:hypothetical protein